MMEIDSIPIGKENKENHETIMHRAKIYSHDEFKTELAKLKEKYIILCDNGYYRPTIKEEYEQFIEKYKVLKDKTQKIIELAEKEMEAL